MIRTVVITLLLLLFSGNGFSAQQPVRFGVFPFLSPKQVLQIFAPIARKIELDTGRPVQLHIAPDAITFENKATEGSYDLLWPNNSTYFKLHKKFNYQAIVSGTPSFKGGVIVRSDSNISHIGELVGKRIGGTLSHSYAGYRFLFNELKAMGYTSPEDFIISQASRADTVVYGVLSKIFDGGTLRLDSIEADNFAAVRNDIKIIAASPAVPQFPFVVHPKLEKGLVEQIRTSLLSLNDDERFSPVLQRLRMKKFVPATDMDYETFRKLMTSLSKQHDLD
ncbi:MAG: phosphate/phosphite/phosphonate ABC transporter substrate-binding protein [Thermodesulfobacteriota bacterium]